MNQWGGSVQWELLRCEKTEGSPGTLASFTAAVYLTRSDIRKCSTNLLRSRSPAQNQTKCRE